MLGIALVSTVTFLVCEPDLPLLLKFTLISASAPGLIGSLGQTGTVQPQLPFAELIIKSALPEFLIIKLWLTTSP